MTGKVQVPFGRKEGKITDLAGALKRTIVAGGAAGNHTVTGIAVGDQLISVVHHQAAAVPADLTSEFSVTAANTINNTGGTATAGDAIEVLWVDLT